MNEAAQMGRESGLRYGPLTGRTVHLCVDMQRLFAAPTAWHLPWMARITPAVHRIARAVPENTVFTRFIPPSRVEEAAGSWRRYYERWPEMTLERLDPALLGLIPELAALVPPALVIDKRCYSPWLGPELLDALRARGADSLVITGAETDVCVLAAVLGAVDHGFRVVIATDALCSISDQTHDAILALYQERFSQQIETACSEAIVAMWG